MHKDDVQDIQLGRIRTFDDSHIKYNDLFLVTPFDSMQTTTHRFVIEFIKTGVNEGKKIRPILIKKIGVAYNSNQCYQRLDGFCRYWAYKELGRETIPCVIGDTPGGQSTLSPFIDEV